MGMSKKMASTIRDDLNEIGSFVTELAQDKEFDDLISEDGAASVRAENDLHENLAYMIGKLFAIRKAIEARQDTRVDATEDPENEWKRGRRGDE